MAPSNSDDERARALRATERRLRMTAKVVLLGEELESSPRRTPQECIELMFELTQAAWVFSGAPWPDLPRSEWPVRRRNLGEPA